MAHIDQSFLYHGVFVRGDMSAFMRVGWLGRGSFTIVHMTLKKLWGENLRMLAGDFPDMVPVLYMTQDP